MVNVPLFLPKLMHCCLTRDVPSRPKPNPVLGSEAHNIGLVKVVPMVLSRLILFKNLTRRLIDIGRADIGDS